MKTLPDWARRGRGGWRYAGSERPEFAATPGPGQESVWDYPRPPRLVADSREVLVSADGVEIARSQRCIKVQETASPPTFYIPREDVNMELLVAASGTSLCEWKGAASYWDVVTPEARYAKVGWSYADPFPEFESIRDFLSFYPARLECYVGGEPVTPQPGEFYGGWVTADVVGPFKGEPGSGGW